MIMPVVVRIARPVLVAVLMVTTGISAGRGGRRLAVTDLVVDDQLGNFGNLELSR